MALNRRHGHSLGAHSSAAHAAHSENDKAQVLHTWLHHNKSTDVQDLHSHTSYPNQIDRGQTYRRTAYAQNRISQNAANAELASCSRSNNKYTNHQNMKHSKMRRVFLIVAIVLACVVVCAGIAFALYTHDLNSKMTIQDPDQQEKLQETLQPVQDDQPFYVMLIGSDTRGDDQGRSDTNIVVRVDPQSKQLTFISIPRDMAVELSGHGLQKFNAAYQFDGAAGTVKAADELLGIHISHYASVDFNATVDLVNSLGGVDVDVPMEINDANAGGQVPQGQQHLNGDQALIFARSRSFVNGDFQRTEDQRLLLKAIVSKLQSTSAPQLAETVDNVAKYIQTDMSASDILSYATAFQGGNVTMYSTMVPSSNVEYEGASYVQCDIKKLKELMQAVDNGEDPSTVVEDTSVSSSDQAIREGDQSTPILTPTD